MIAKLRHTFLSEAVTLFVTRVLATVTLVVIVAITAGLTWVGQLLLATSSKEDVSLGLFVLGLAALPALGIVWTTIKIAIDISDYFQMVQQNYLLQCRINGILNGPYIRYNHCGSEYTSWI